MLNDGRNDITSVMSSLNQSLLDKQPSNAISQSFVDLDQDEDELTSYDNDMKENGQESIEGVKEAIVDLYLAIKIRSTEELDQINEDNLKTEKKKLLRTCDCFQLLEYIRSSIEIIMNLKIEDLEKNDQKKTPQSYNNYGTSRHGQDTEMSLSKISVASKNLILQSMKDALIYMIENKETADNVDALQAESASKHGSSLKKSRGVKGPPLVYEKIIQKLESDIRGHIRLEHEMKIHMDYLEGKVEKLQKDQEQLNSEKQRMEQKMENLHKKMKEIEEDRDLKDAQLQQKKMQNDKLQTQVHQLKRETEQMSLKIEQSFTMPPTCSNNADNRETLSSFLHKQPTSTLSAVALPQNHLQIKHKYNSIDVGYDDQASIPQANGDFDDAFMPKKTRTNTNISG